MESRFCPARATGRSVLSTGGFHIFVRNKTTGECMFNYKVFLAELIGTFALVFVGAAAGLYNAGLLAVALAHGLTLAVFAYAFGHISGTHINPAVTFGLALNGTVKWSEAVVYWVAQLVGAVLAAFALNAAVGIVNAEAFGAAQTTGVLTERFPYYA